VNGAQRFNDWDRLTVLRGYGAVHVGRRTRPRAAAHAKVLGESSQSASMGIHGGVVAGSGSGRGVGGGFRVGTGTTVIEAGGCE